MNLQETLNTNNISKIAEFISQDWNNINFGAKPYLDAMKDLNKITDNYFEDYEKTIVLYFLANARTYKGENARQIKKYLNNLIDEN